LGASLLGFSILPLNLLSVGLLLTLFFTAFTLLEASLPTLVSKLAPPESKGAAMGIYSTLQFLGIFVGGSLAGLLFKHTSFQLVFGFCLGLTMIWLGIVYFTTPQDKKAIP
jgi:predicted MFS family arabinose efflux permease